MALISINPLNLSYKQYEAQPASISVRFSNLSSNDVIFGPAPNWLSVGTPVAVDATTVDVLFTIAVSSANTLNAGLYNFVLEAYTDTTPNVKEADLTVNFTLTETVVLVVNPENISFNYNAGSSMPAAKIVTVFSENNWTVTSSVPWATTSIAAGVNDGSFSVSVDATGLNTATHNGVVSVDDGTTVKNITISLLVSDGNTVDDYLYVTPSEIEFYKNVGSSVNPTKTVSLNSSGNWSATTSAAWLLLSTEAGSSGSDVITLSLDTAMLTEGVFNSEIAIVNSNILRKVYVTLYYNSTSLIVPDSGVVYFAEDNVRLELTSGNATSLLEVDFKSILEAGVEVYSKKAPFMKGVASLNIGEEIKDFTTKTVMPAEIESGVYNFIKPVEMSFTAYEKDYFTAVLLDVIERNSLLFFNGKTPLVSNKFCYLPDVITVTRSAFISFHIYALVPPTEITITGAINKVIPNSKTYNGNVYSGFLNLNEFNLTDLDILTVSFGFLEFKVRIKEAAAESITLSYENEWCLPEFIELTGEMVIYSAAGYLTQKIQKVNFVYEEIYDVVPGETFSIYTGYIESAAEVVWLNKIRNSEKVYLLLNNEQIEVIPTFPKLITYKTREHQKNYKLTFRKAIV